MKRAVWLGSGAVALALHLALISQGAAAYAARIRPVPKPDGPQIAIAAPALSLPGESSAPQVVAAATPARKVVAGADRVAVAAPQPAAAAPVTAAPTPATAAATRPARVEGAEVAAPQQQPATTAEPARAAASVPVQPQATPQPAARAAAAAPQTQDAAQLPRPAANAPATPPARIAAAPVAAPAPAGSATALAPAAPRPATAAQPGRASIAPPPGSPALQAQQTASAAEPVAAPQPQRAVDAAEPVAPPQPQPNPIAAAPVTAPEPQRLASAETPLAQRPTSTAKTVTVPAAVRPPTAAVPALPDTGQTVAAPARPVVQPTAPAAAPPPGIAAPQPATPADGDAYQTVLAALAAYDGGPCFAALPVLSAEGSFQLDTFARSEADLDRFRTAIRDSSGALPNTHMKAISDAQCSALPFVAKSPAYPTFRLYFDLPERRIASGNFLAGRVVNAGGGITALLLIDDEGLVQNIGAFLTPEAGAAAFSIPMTVTGQTVETQQLMLALSTPAPLAVVRDLTAAAAPDFFAALQAELDATGVEADMALAAFSVQ